MAGQLTISTLKSDTGVLATQNGMTGIAKAWVNFNGFTAAIRSSFNVSSITRSGTGTYAVNFTTAMPDANYAGVYTNNAAFAIQSASVAPTTTVYSLSSYSSTPTLTDATYNHVAVFSA